MGKNFVKRGPVSHAAMFAAEAQGLAALAATGAVRVPAVHGHGVDNGQAWIALERLELKSPTRAASAALGRQLAALHRHVHEAHGWERDNFIGLSVQPNGFERDWARFFATQRLGYQLDLAARNGWTGSLQEAGAELCTALPKLLGHGPAPSLLHGDLWTGNHAMLPDGTPVLYDPAVHYGDRECDLAMAALFGGFSPAFFDAYEEAWPLPVGWGARRSIYQLYHVLNHLNLFGGGYLAQAEALLDVAMDP